MTQLIIHTFQLELAQTFRIARSARDHQPTLIVELKAEGLSGLGEATANAYYQVTIPQMVALLEQHRSRIEQFNWQHPIEFEAFLQKLLPQYPFLRCALDEAANDLWAKKMQLPLYKALELKRPKQLPLTNYTIGIDSVAKMVEKMQQMPWPIYKVKLGTPDDLAIIKALRAATTAKFRVDANEDWTAEQTIALAEQMQPLGVEFIEQPLPATEDAQMPTVFQHSLLPLAADESCRTEDDVKKCVGKFHIINIKLMKCGGITPALRMIAQARQLGLQVMIGCMTESSVGISAIAHLLPLLDYVDMDGALLLKNDPTEGVTIQAGQVQLTEELGLGVRLK